MLFAHAVSLFLRRGGGFRTSGPTERCAGAPFAFVRRRRYDRARTHAWVAALGRPKVVWRWSVAWRVDQGLLVPEEGAAHRACGRFPSTPTDTPSLVLTRPAGRPLHVRADPGAVSLSGATACATSGRHDAQICRPTAASSPRRSRRLGAGRKWRGAGRAAFFPACCCVWHPLRCHGRRTRVSPADTCARVGARRVGVGC